MQCDDQQECGSTIKSAYNVYGARACSKMLLLILNHLALGLGNAENFTKTNTRSVRRTVERPVHHSCISFSVI